MKFFVQGWNDGEHTKSFTVGADPTKHDHFSTYQLYVVAQFFIVPPGDPEREQRALMLANKVRNFLNELEEKKTQIAELMNIAGQ